MQIMSAIQSLLVSLLQWHRHKFLASEQHQFTLLAQQCITCIPHSQKL